MATSSTIDRLESMLANASEKFAPFASKAVLACEEAVKEIIQVYPPQPDRMRSGRLNTYVRSQGWYPKSAFIADTKAPGGFRTKRVPRGKIRMTSQQMDKRWVEQVEAADAGGVNGTLENTATYSGLVVGWKDGDPQQKSYHAVTGWVAADDAIDAAGPEIDAIMDETDEAWLSKVLA